VLHSADIGHQNNIIGTLQQQHKASVGWDRTI